MKTVYIVTSGSYSDYGIRSVWDNYDDAKEAADLFGGDGCVEEYVLNSNSRPNNPLWGAHMLPSGFRLDKKATDPSEAGNVATRVWHNKLTGEVFAQVYGLTPGQAEKKLYDAIAEYKAKLNNL